MNGVERGGPQGGGGNHEQFRLTQLPVWIDALRPGLVNACGTAAHADPDEEESADQASTSSIWMCG
jgi:hypothetical protein